MSGFFEWLGDLWESCVDGILGFFRGLWNVIWEICCNVGNFILDLINYVWDWVIYGFYKAIDWMLCQFVSFLDWLGTMINFDFMNTLLQNTTFISYFQAVNSIVPLDILLLCGTSFLGVLLTWCVYKFVKSWIPFVNGT